MAIREGLSYDDVLLEPAYSTVSSRNDIELMSGFINGDHYFDHPVIPANMADVAGEDLLRAQLNMGGLAIMHRFQEPEAQVEMFKRLGHDTCMAQNIAASIGVGYGEYKAAELLVEAGITIICVDVAHGDHYLNENIIRLLREMKRRPTIIAGNVATRAGARRLFEAGADVVKVGVGPGSLCTTRIETGCGVPQLTAVMDVAALRDEHFPFRAIIADGGIKSAGDCVKALCFANMVMVGRLFAGCDEAPGEVQDQGYKGKFKKYRGSSTHKTRHIEGVQAWVEPTGEYADVLGRLLEGIRSGCSYQGVDRLSKLREDPPNLIKITSAGLRESYPHDVMPVRTDEG